MMITYEERKIIIDYYYSAIIVYGLYAITRLYTRCFFFFDEDNDVAKAGNEQVNEECERKEI